MKILLIRPPVPKYTIGLKHVMICEPLELEYLAAGLEGHEVEILDLILERNPRRNFVRFKPDIVATSCYITGVNEAIKICRSVKRWKADCLTVVGGVHASVAPEDFADPSVDCIALGDGTSLMSSLVDVVSGKCSLTSIENLAIPSAPNRVVRTTARAYMLDPDTLPFPRRDLTAHLRARYYYLFHQPVALMKTTWGCWYDCSFCMTWGVTGGKVYSRSPESIVRELETIAEDEVYIVDDIFLISTPRLSEIARLIKEKNIHKRFLVYGRADFIAENKEIIRTWAGIGLTAVIIGLEANTPEELSTLGKKTTTNQNRQAVDILRQNGVDIYASLIPQPWYEHNDWEKLFSFIEETGLYYVNISPLTPQPGSPIFKTQESELIIPRRAHPLWDLTHCVLPTKLPLKDYYRQLLRLYARTVLSIRRAARLTLRTRPPIWSYRYLRLWLGAVRIFFQFINAHRHHTGRRLKQATDRGREIPGLEYQGHNLSSCDLTKTKAKPHHRFGDFFNKIKSLKLHELLNIPNARRWFKLLGWGVPIDLYTLQQATEGKAGQMVLLHGQKYMAVSSYDYLGLIGHPEIEQAAIEAVHKYGTSSGGVRLLTGTTDLHQQLDQRIATFKKVEDCLTFSSGYLANIAAISSLLRSDDHVIIDNRVHRSIVDACQLARVKLTRFQHNDCNSLEDTLRSTSTGRRTLIVVEGVYSMDGDICPLPEIVALKHRYGASLMVDEAHSFGVLGATGRGVDEHFGISSDEIDLWMGTLSKAIPSTGGFIAGRHDLIIYMQHGAAPYMFSAAGTPPSVATALTAIEILQREPERLTTIRENANFLRNGLKKLGYNTGLSESQIVPVIIGSNMDAINLSAKLFRRGLIAPTVGTPAVLPGTSRLRLCATAAQNRNFLIKVINHFEACLSGKTLE